LLGIDLEGCILEVEFKYVALLWQMLYNMNCDVLQVLFLVFNVDDGLFLELDRAGAQQLLAPVEQNLILCLYVG